MISIKNKVPLIIIIILLLVLLIFTLWDIFYENQLLQLFDFILERQILLRTLILYGILIIITVIIIFSQMKKKFETISRSGRIFERSLGRNLHYFKCPKCNEIIAIKKLKSKDDRSFITACPCCGTIGRIPSMPKSSEIKFECKNCGEQVSIFLGGAKPSHGAVVYSCPYCGKKHTMKNV